MGNTHAAQDAREISDLMTHKPRIPPNYKWGYARGNTGPSSWWVYYPLATGNNQSPIDIEPDNADIDEDLSDNPLRIFYQRHEKAAILTNTGRTCQVSFRDSDSCISGGPLRNRYTLYEMNIHWSEHDDWGSEHTIHGKGYSAELQIMHWNSDMYRSVQDALVGDEGIAALAVFMDVRELETSPLQCSAMQYLCQHLPEIRYADQSLLLSPSFDVAAFLPNDLSVYWTYEGSLTTPPCSENVTWVVFHEPLKIAKSLLQSLRELYSYTMAQEIPQDEFHGILASNCRPVQPQGERKVYTTDSWDPLGLHLQDKDYVRRRRTVSDFKQKSRSHSDKEQSFVSQFDTRDLW